MTLARLPAGRKSFYRGFTFRRRHSTGKRGEKKKRKEVYIALWEIPFETSHKLVRLLLEDVYLYGKWKKKRISESGYGGDAQMGLDIMYKPIDSKEGAQHRIKKRLNSENVFTTDGLFLRLFDTIMRHWYWTLFFHSCWPAVISIQVTRPPSNSSYRTARKKQNNVGCIPFRRRASYLLKTIGRLLEGEEGERKQTIKTGIDLLR